jgi:hypothetical protein
MLLKGVSLPEPRSVFLAGPKEWLDGLATLTDEGARPSGRAPRLPLPEPDRAAQSWRLRAWLPD